MRGTCVSLDVCVCVCVPSEPTIKLVMSWFMLAWDLEMIGNLSSKMGSEGETWWWGGLEFSLPVSMGFQPLHSLCCAKETE